MDRQCLLSMIAALRRTLGRQSLSARWFHVLAVKMSWVPSAEARLDVQVPLLFKFKLVAATRSKEEVGRKIGAFGENKADDATGKNVGRGWSSASEPFFRSCGFNF